MEVMFFMYISFTNICMLIIILFDFCDRVACVEKKDKKPFANIHFHMLGHFTIRFEEFEELKPIYIARI